MIRCTDSLRGANALLLALAAAIFVFAPREAEAQKLYSLQITVGLNSGYDDTNKLSKIDDLFRPDNIAAVIGDDFDPLTDAFSGALNVRGLGALVSWNPSIPGLLIEIPGVPNIDINAETLEDSLNLLQDFLEGDTDLSLQLQVLLDAVLKELVASSPVEPIAGNPFSLQSQMFEHDWRMATSGPLTSGSERLDPATNLVSMGLDYGYAKAGRADWDVNLVTLPLDYRFNFKNPKWSILFELPVTATFTEDQWSVLAHAALGLQYRPTQWLSITPMARVGGVGSLDVGALGLLYSVTVTADTSFEWLGLRWGFATMGGFAKSIDEISISGTQLNYDLTNEVLRLGGDVAGGLGELWGAPLEWTAFGSMMQFFGDDLYLDRQNEIGLGINRTRTIGGKPYSALGFSASAVFGGDGSYTGTVLRFFGHF